MTPEAQRVVITKACPTVAEIDNSNGGCFWKSPHPFVQFDPFNDLNAIHTAIQTLSDVQKYHYLRWLDEVTEPTGEPKFQTWPVLRISNATPAQCCEAFLRTLNLWIDQ